MLTRVNELFIGKDIALGTETALKDIQDTATPGEIFILDKDFQVAATTVTYADTNVIYIAEVLDYPISFEKEDGTTVTGNRVLVSNPIDGRDVSAYTKEDYVAPVEKAVQLGAIASVTAGTEYVLRIVYKDLPEHPGQFTETYRYVAQTGDESEEVYTGIKARIDAYRGKHFGVKGGARVTATLGGEGTVNETLTLTGKVVPEGTTSLNDIDEFKQVDFQAFMNYVDNDGNWTTAATATTTVQKVRGNGHWALVRDLEKQAMSYQGIDNRIWFPITLPAFRTVKNAEYKYLILEYNTQYRSADNQYVKNTPLTSVIAIDNASGALNQGNSIEDTLDSWTESVPVPVKDDLTDIFVGI